MDGSTPIIRWEALNGLSSFKQRKGHEVGGGYACGGIGVGSWG